MAAITCSRSRKSRPASLKKEAATWSAMKGHIYVIADALTDALAKAVPRKVLRFGAATHDARPRGTTAAAGERLFAVR